MRKKTAVVTFSGFTENFNEGTGTMRLFREVLLPFDENQNRAVEVFQPREWSDSPKKVASLIRFIGYERVILVGYSWGAGWASMKFAKECKKLGIPITLALFCDPVYRPTWMPSWMGANPLSFRSIFRFVRIKVPESVEVVKWVRQRKSIPRGHDLFAENPAVTTIEKGKEIKLTHTQIDSSPEWFNLVEEELKKITDEPLKT